MERRTDALEETGDLGLGPAEFVELAIVDHLGPHDGEGGGGMRIGRGRGLGLRRRRKIVGGSGGDGQQQGGDQGESDRLHVAGGGIAPPWW